MKFLHTADWHIGKSLNGFSMLDEQKYAFEKVMEIADEENVDAIVIAGDLYDKAIPPTEAVQALDEMFQVMNLEKNYPVYAVSGNHDGSERLNFANSWMAKNQLFLHTKISESFTPIETEDAQIFMVPFFDPIDARAYYGISETSEMSNITQAMTRVIADIEEKFVSDKLHILITHFHVTSAKNEEYKLTSETTSTVGGLNAVPSSLFKNFDYVALGHLHLKEASPSDVIRYSGSLVKFNTDEAQQTKGVYIVEANETGVTTEFVKIPPKKDLIVLRGSFEELTQPEFYNAQPAKGTAYFAIVITERTSEKNIRARLSEIYGDVIEMKFDLKKEEAKLEREVEATLTAKSPDELIGEFYVRVTGTELSEFQNQVVEDVLVAMKRGEEA
jgi:exonuclease SbcD